MLETLKIKRGREGKPREIQHTGAPAFPADDSAVKFPVLPKEKYTLQRRRKRPYPGTRPLQKIPKPFLPAGVKAKRAAQGLGSSSHGERRQGGPNLYMKMSRLLARGFRQRKQASKKWPCGSPPAVAPARPTPPPPPPDRATNSSSTPELTSRVHAAADAPPPPRANVLSRPPVPPLPLRPPPPVPVLPAAPGAKSIGGGEGEPAPGSTSPPRQCDRARPGSVARVFVSARRCEQGGGQRWTVCLKGRQEVEVVL